MLTVWSLEWYIWGKTEMGRRDGTTLVDEPRATVWTSKSSDLQRPKILAVLVDGNSSHPGEQISAGSVNRMICHPAAFRSNSVAYETPIAPTWLGPSWWRLNPVLELTLEAAVCLRSGNNSKHLLILASWSSLFGVKLQISTLKGTCLPSLKEIIGLASCRSASYTARALGRVKLKSRKRELAL